MAKVYTAKQFVGLYNANVAEREIDKLFSSEFDHCGRNRAAVNAATASIKGRVIMINFSCLILTLIGVESFFDHEFLKGSQNEVIVKEISIVAKNVLHTFHFRITYAMHPQGSA